MKLECYDLRGVSRDGGIALRALMPGKSIEEMPRPFDPYCYVPSHQFDVDAAKHHGLDIAGSEHPDGFVKLEAQHPSPIRDFADSTTADVYEADVSYSTRAVIDENIDFIRPDDSDVLFFDIEVDDTGRFEEPTDARSRILSIAGVDGNGNEIYFDDDDEKSLVKQFLQAADDYYVLVGWNSLDYDYRYLENRTPKLGLDVDWSRWVKLDLMPLYDMLAIPTKTVSLKLDDTGERELDEGKTGVRAGGGRLLELWESNPEELRRYNIQDCDLLRRLDDKYELIDLLYVICNLCNYPPGASCYIDRNDKPRFGIGQVVDAKLLEVAKRQGIPQPCRGDFNKPDDFPGGYVLQPTPGLYENVVVPDYSGMYPNIVRAFNFGRETWRETKKEIYEDYGTGAKVIEGESGYFVHPDDGGRSVPAEAADELIEMRDGASEILDKGVKAVNNTLYGVFAADFHRYFGPHSENITLIGQKLTGVVEEIAGRGHPDIKEVVYGDTDSVMISMADPDDPVAAAHRIAEDLQHEMQVWADSRNAQSKYLTLDVDDVYDIFYIGDKKKRYFGHRIFDGSECDNVKVRGFEVRQHNWPKPVRDMQRELMSVVLEGGSVNDVVSKYKDKLFAGEFDDQLATETTLTKPVDEYGSKSAHVTAAKELREEKGRSAAKVGDKVGYVKYGPDADDVTWAYEDEVGRTLHSHHYSYIWENKFKSVMRSIDVSQYEQTGLNQFA